MRGEMMNFGKILNLIAQNNINPEQLFVLVERIKNSDLKDEQNIRQIITEVSKIAGKKLDKQKEDQLVKKVINEGVNEDIFDFL
jgi:ribosomal protein S3AE